MLSARAKNLLEEQNTTIPVDDGIIDYRRIES